MKSKIFMVLLFAVILILGTIGIASAKGTLVYGSSGDASSVTSHFIRRIESF